MARKPDLFALIAAHNKSVGKSGSSGDSASSRGPSGVGPTSEGQPQRLRKSSGLQPLLSSARHWLHTFADRVVPQARRKTGPGAKPVVPTEVLRSEADPSKEPTEQHIRRSHAKELRLGGIGVAVVALVALGLGFVAGRAFGRPADGGKPASETELNAPAKGSKDAKWLINPVGGALPTGEKLSQELANWCYPVILYQASERAKAEQLASYLWNHGVVSARIRPFTHKSSDTNETKDYWATVVYVKSEKDGQPSVEELAKVPTPAFAPNLPEMIGRLRELVSQGRGLVAVPTR